MTTKCYDLYGTRTLSLDALSAAVAATLSIDMEGRQSDFLGGDYFRSGSVGEENFVVQTNHLDFPDEGDLLEDEFSDYLVLLKVNTTTRPDELKARLLTIDGLEFLRREVL